MSDIKDFSGYTSEMKKSLLDKIFFMDKIDTKIIIDYGCADGVLLKFLSLIFPDFTYVGFDIDEKMLEEARKDNDTITFTSDWNKVESLLDPSENPTILMSSVLHEVYAYGTRKDVDLVWGRMFSGKFTYIVIRDMIPSITLDKKSDINDVRKIMKYANSGLIRDFEQVWGSIEQNKNLVHFLLKYRYVNNWDREVRENYFPIYREELFHTIPENYTIVYHDHFILPFIKTVVNKDFKIDMKDNTHLKIILKIDKN